VDADPLVAALGAAGDADLDLARRAAAEVDPRGEAPVAAADLDALLPAT
jgi:hypothetical protein